MKRSHAILAAVLIVVVAALVGRKSLQTATTVAPEPTMPQIQIPKTEPSTPSPLPDDPGASNDMFAAADVNSGAKLTAACKICHSFGADRGTQGKVGPNLYGIYGAPIAAIEGFAYTDSLIALRGRKWTIRELNEWLKSPSDYAPGTRMSFGGFTDEQDRMDLIAYLTTLR